MKTETVIKEYIRNEANVPTGVVVCVRKGNTVSYGYSLCSPADRFNKRLAETIAVQRSRSGTLLLPDAEDRNMKVLNAYNRLANRAKRYFKDLPVEAVEF